MCQCRFLWKAATRIDKGRNLNAYMSALENFKHFFFFSSLYFYFCFVFRLPLRYRWLCQTFLIYEYKEKTIIIIMQNFSFFFFIYLFVRFSLVFAFHSDNSRSLLFVILLSVPMGQNSEKIGRTFKPKK